MEPRSVLYRSPVFAFRPDSNLRHGRRALAVCISFVAVLLVLPLLGLGHPHELTLARYWPTVEMMAGRIVGGSSIASCWP